jgi:ActR/RegA family two-component response regulator/AraC-like DNA-binding protein
VLLVEDDAAVANALGRQLVAEGLDVDRAEDGEAGLAKGRTRTHDVIVLDLQLPRLPGLQVLRSLRSEGVMTPVLILTGFASVDSAFESAHLGAGRYLMKPISGEVVAAAVRALVEHGVGAAPFVESPAARSASIVGLLRHLDVLAGLADADPLAHRIEAGRAGLSRAIAHTLASRRLTFFEFVAGARALRYVQAHPEVPVQAIVPIVRDSAEEAARPGGSLDARVEQVLSRIDAASRARSPFSERALAADLRMSRNAIWRLLHRELGMTFRKCRQTVLMRRAVLALAHSDEHVRQIAFSLGYRDPAHFGHDFRGYFRSAPTEFRHLLAPSAARRSPARTRRHQTDKESVKDSRNSR